MARSELGGGMTRLEEAVQRLERAVGRLEATESRPAPVRPEEIAEIAARVDAALARIGEALDGEG
jgi:hypothetical protein